MPTNRIVKPFGGENRPIIKRGKKSTKAAAISVRYPISQYQSATLNYVDVEDTQISTSSSNQIDNQRNKRGNHKRKPLRDVTNDNQIRTNRRHSSKQSRPSDCNNDLNIMTPSQATKKKKEDCEKQTNSNDVNKISARRQSSKAFTTEITPKINNRGKNAKYDVKSNHSNKASSPECSDMDCSSNVTSKSQEGGDSINQENIEQEEYDSESQRIHSDKAIATTTNKKRKRKNEITSKDVLELLLKSCDRDDKHRSKKLKSTYDYNLDANSNDEMSQSKPTILGTDVLIQSSGSKGDDESEVTADTVLNTVHINVKVDEDLNLQRRSEEEDQDNDSYLSVNPVHPELPPGWKVYLSRSKNRPYYVHPDHGATWYFPGGHAGWRKEYSKTRNQVYYAHPDHGKTWYRPTSLTNDDETDNVHKGKLDVNSDQSEAYNHRRSAEEIVQVEEVLAHAQSHKLSTKVKEIDRTCVLSNNDDVQGDMMSTRANNEKLIPTVDLNDDNLDEEIGRGKATDLTLSIENDGPSPRSSCIDDVSTETECRPEFEDNNDINSPGGMQFDSSSSSQIQCINSNENTPIQCPHESEEMESSEKPNIHTKNDTGSTHYQQLGSTLAETLSGLRDYDHLKEAEEDNSFDLHSHSEDEDYDSDKFGVDNNENVTAKDGHQRSYVDVTFRLKVLSSRVLNPTNPLCSLQQLREVVKKKKTTIAGMSRRNLKTGKHGRRRLSRKMS